MKHFTILLIAAFLSTALATKAQPNIHETKSSSMVLFGSVASENGRGLPYATINLFNLKDSALLKTTTTDSAGTYQFNILAAGYYFITASMTGYRDNSSAAIVTNEASKNFHVPAIRLAVISKSLAAVTVTAKKSFIERKIDRTVLNVENSVLAAGSTALETLEKAPGIVVDKDGNISMAGKSGVLVMIDGKPTYMSNADLAQLLRTMQSSQIETIELITNPSAKYDAAGNAGIINIKTKKSKTIGTNGSVNIGSGYGNKYKGNAGISLNHRNEKINLFGNYHYGSNYTGRIMNINRISKLNNLDTYFDQRQLEDKHYGNNNFKAGADFFINSKNTLGFLINGYANSSATTSANTTRVGTTEKVADSLISVVGKSEGTYHNIAYNINYRLVFDSTGKELTIDADYSHNSSGNYTTYNNYFLGNDGATLKAPYLNRNNTPSVINIKSFKADYTWPVSKSMKVEAGLKSSIVSTDNDLRFEELDNGNWKNNMNRSNHFIYDETIHAGYINAYRQVKNTSIQFGIRAEKTISQGNSVTENKIVKRSYLNFFPSLFVNHSFSGNHSVNFSYSRRIDRPAYDALNPFVYYVDEYTFEKGNPFLNPQYTHSFEAGYIYKRKYTATFNYSLTNDIITDVILPDTARKAIYQTSANVKTANFLSLTLNAPLTITKWWNAINTVTIFNNQYQTTGLEGLDLNVNQTSFYLNTNHSLTLPAGFAAEVSGKYTSSNVYGTLRFGSSCQTDLGLSKSLLNKKANIKFSVSDVFNTRQMNVYSTLSNVNYHIYQKPESRVFRLTFSYRFGSSSIKEARSHSTGLESEQSRIKK